MSEMANLTASEEVDTPSSVDPAEYFRDNDYPWYFHDERKLMWIALAPKLSSAVSMALSILIVVTILRDRQIQRRMYHRLMFVSCLWNVFSAPASFLSSWAMPRDTEIPPLPWTYGNDRTCQTQAFFIQMSSSRAFSNAATMIYFVLVVRYGWREARLRRVEPWLHGVPFLWGVTTATVVVARRLHGIAMPFCWIDAVKYQTYQLTLYYIPVWTNLVVVLVCVCLIGSHVRRLEQKTSRFKYETTAHAGAEGTEPTAEAEENKTRWAQRRSSTTSRTYRNRSREAACQGFWFAAAFFFLWTPFTVAYVVHWVSGTASFPLLFLGGLITPIQGLPIALIYFAPKWRTERRRDPTISTWCILRRVLAPAVASS